MTGEGIISNYASNAIFIALLICQSSVYGNIFTKHIPVFISHFASWTTSAKLYQQIIFQFKSLSARFIKWVDCVTCTEIENIGDCTRDYIGNFNWLTIWLSLWQKACKSHFTINSLLCPWWSWANFIAVRSVTVTVSLHVSNTTHRNL